MTNLPRQTAGRKGGKVPPKKSITWRKTIPYEQRQKWSSVDTSQNETPALLASHSSSSPCNWDWSPKMSQPPTSLFTPPPPPPPAGNLPFTDFTNYCSTQPYPRSSTRNTDLNSTNITSDPLFIKILNGRIKVCTGCKGQHHKNSNKGMLSPPHGIHLGHKESLSFANPNSGAECSKMGNAYYHINLECIRRKHPNFTATLVVSSRCTRKATSFSKLLAIDKIDIRDMANDYRTLVYSTIFSSLKFCTSKCCLIA